jgi:hypothetical protein
VVVELGGVTIDFPAELDDAVSLDELGVPAPAEEAEAEEETDEADEDTEDTEADTEDNAA